MKPNLIQPGVWWANSGQNFSFQTQFSDLALLNLVYQLFFYTFGYSIYIWQHFGFQRYAEYEIMVVKITHSPVPISPTCGVI